MNKLTELCEEAALGGAKIIALPEAGISSFILSSPPTTRTLTLILPSLKL